MKITTGTIARTIAIILAIVNIVLKQLGYDIINVSESEILTFVEAVLEVAVIAVGFWKNNSYTEKAIKADDFLRTLKEGE